MDIERVYSEWLDSKNEEYKERHIGLEKSFSASSAGHCYKKHMFKVMEAPQKELEDRSKRILRLGTLVHKDFEDAVKYYIESNSELLDEYKFFVEHQIRIPKYNVVGHLDFAVLTVSSGQIVVYDYKTSASYKWSLKFGRKYKDKNPNFNYEMQLSTYLLGMEQELDFTPTSQYMAIVWYNKDTSRMREEEIELSFVGMAKEYWEELNSHRRIIQKDDKELEDYEKMNLQIKRNVEVGVPFQNWECKYCPYEHICK
jgi:CRISPR/Cas system-associated exonuclease Cas4 (RecB family)